jgi:hypothetical protein
MKIYNLWVISFCILVTSTAHALRPITELEHKKLMKGEQISYVEWREGFVWPAVSVRVMIDHMPEQNMAEFMKFENHKNYIPDVMDSKVIKKISPENVQVYLAMEMPWPVKKSEQVTNNILTKEADGSLTLTWSLVSAKFVKATDGHIRFTPYSGKTLLEYETFIVPNSSFAGMFKDRVPLDVEKTVKFISHYLNLTLDKRKL